LIALLHILKGKKLNKREKGPVGEGGGQSG